MKYTTPTPEHGFEILRKAQNLKFELNRSGPDGQISFAKACIWFGLTEPDDIIAEACAIAGDHVEARFETLLMEGENIHWLRTGDGQLALLSN